MIEKEQREAERRPITKITHKGEIEIESQEPVKAPEPVEVRVSLCCLCLTCIEVKCDEMCILTLVTSLHIPSSVLFICLITL